MYRIERDGMTLLLWNRRLKIKSYLHLVVKEKIVEYVIKENISGNQKMAINPILGHGWQFFSSFQAAERKCGLFKIYAYKELEMTTAAQFACFNVMSVLILQGVLVNSEGYVISCRS